MAKPERTESYLLKTKWHVGGHIGHRSGVPEDRRAMSSLYGRLLAGFIRPFFQMCAVYADPSDAPTLKLVAAAESQIGLRFSTRVATSV